MKKVLAILLAVVVVVTIAAACAKKEVNSNENPSATISEIPTEKAVIKDNDTIKFIQEAYSKKELGLDGVDDNYTFMVSSSGSDIEGKNYIRVVASVMTQNEQTNDDGQATYSMTTLGEYFISYDGKTVLMRDQKTGDYVTLPDRSDQYKGKGN